jgi:hypothetical protein
MLLLRAYELGYQVFTVVGKFTFIKGFHKYRQQRDTFNEGRALWYVRVLATPISIERMLSNAGQIRHIDDVSYSRKEQTPKCYWREINASH